jgi:hypothetical protein
MYKKEQQRSLEQTEPKEDMTMEEAKAYRASLATNIAKLLTEKQKRQAFKVYWTENKKKYGLTGKMEQILWLHLVSTKNDSPENFEAGLKNFGVKSLNREK